MLFPPEHAGHVKTWIVKRLENISDADADVLADYVMALMEHDGDVETVRKLCETEIPDFLREDSALFIDDVFRTIQYQSYLPGARPPPPRPQPAKPRQAVPKPTAMTPAPPLPPGSAGLIYDDVPMSQAAPLLPHPAMGGSRKRAFHENGDGDPRSTGADPRFGGRPVKQARRGGRGARNRDRYGDASGFRQPSQPFGPGFPGGGAQWQQGPGGLPNFDMGQAMDNILGTVGMPMQSQAPAMAPSSRKRPRCRDYDTKGYCSRGNTCTFEHGTGSEPAYLPNPTATGAFQITGPRTGTEGEYDPGNANLLMNAFPMLVPPNGRIQQVQRGGQRGGGMRQNNASKKARKSALAADGPVFDRKRSTLVVENIPEESFSGEAVREFFSQFGSILEVSMQPYKRLAIVKFDNWTSANAAFSSPKVVFENRFVKVFWYAGDQSALPNSMSVSAGPAEAVGPHKEGSAGNPSQAEQEPDLDMDEFIRRQEQSQKAQEEKKRKLEELEQQKEELQKKQKELMLKRQEEMARLNAKLALSAKKEREATAAAANPADAANAADDAADATAPSSKPTQADILRAQLAALEKEAIEMGIDPNGQSEPDFSPAHSPSPWAPRGRGGGGYLRARGRFPRGGFRGGYRAGSNDVTYAAYSLDNRPKKVAVLGVDFTVPERDESLRAYLFGIGEFTHIQTTTSQTDITFKDRKTAETFVMNMAAKDIPGVDGSVEVAWVGADGALIKSVPSTPRLRGTPPNGHINGAGATATSHHGPAPGGLPQKDVRPVTEEESEASAMFTNGDDKDVSFVLDRQTEQADSGEQNEQGENGYMDYDVADENQWDIG